MADLSNSSWSETDSNNSQPSPDGFPSGILPSQVGGAIRAMRGAVKRSYDRSNAMIVSGGSTADNVYTLTYEQPPTGYVKGEVYRFFANFTNTAAALVNINGLGNKNLNRADGAALSGGELVAGQVVTAIYDGANFLHQSTGTRNFKDNVSIQTNSDAYLTIESLAAPTTSFRRKQIFSSANVDGGNDWLFRQTRPSDGATKDFILDDAAPGTIWTTGNFTPALKADLAGAVFTGDITTHRGNTSGVLYLGRQDQNGGRYIFYDGSQYVLPNATTNVAGLTSSGAIRSSSGDMHTHRNNNTGYLFFGAGDNGYVGHDGNNFVAIGPGNLFINGIETTRQNQYHSASGYGFAARNTYLYADTGTDNFVIRTGNASSGYKYGTFGVDGLLTSAGSIRGNGDVIATGRVVVGEGQNLSYIEMRDTDEGTRYVHNNSGCIGFLGKDAAWKFQVRDDGSLWCAQFGDLNGRIEARGQAWGEWGRNQAVTSFRMVFIADLDITANYNGGMAEYYGGSCVTGRASIVSGDQNDIVLRNMRFRQNQIYIATQGWVAAYFA